MLINKNQTSLKLNNLKNNKIYLILQLQCLFNTPANFTFTGKFHTDNTQHLSPVYQIPHLPSQTQPTHIYDSQTGLWTYMPTFSHLPNSIDTHTDLCQTQAVFRRTWTDTEELLKEKSFFILSFVFLSEFVIRQVQTNIY